MNHHDFTGPVMLSMTFSSRYQDADLDVACRRLSIRLEDLPGMVAARAIADDPDGMVTVVCVFTSLVVRERFVLSSLYDRLPAVAGMVFGTRTSRRSDLGVTDRDDLAALQLAS